MRQLFIEKVELQAALFVTRLKQFVLTKMDIKKDKIFHRTYLITVLQWLPSAHKCQQVFVANRKTETLGESTVDERRHVPGIIHPANIGKGGVNVRVFYGNQWVTGSGWLYRKETESPEQPIYIKKIPEEINHPSVASGNDEFDCSQYSNFGKLVSIMAVILQVRSKMKNVQIDPLEERISAELQLPYLSQKGNFADIFQSLKKNQPLIGQNTYSELSPFIHSDGSLRLTGRLNKSNVLFNQKHLIMLSAKHPVAILLLRKALYENQL